MTPRIVFMGTPDFAATALDALIKADYSVVGVFTRADKPKGRGHVLTPPPVKVLAGQHGIPVYQPTTLKNGAYAEELKALAPDLIIVAAYGMLLPPEIIHLPLLGCINIHGSLLPRHRGAAPMQRAIMEGDKETGITIMRMDEGLDTGDMLLVRALPISDTDNFETVHDRMASLGASALLEALPGIIDGSIVARKQDDALATYARKIEKADCSLDLTKDAATLARTVRALSPIPLAYTEHKGTVIKIPAAVIGKAHGVFGTPGLVLSLEGGRIEVALGDGTLCITEVIPAGKGRMKASDYINGRRIAVGDILGGNHGAGND